jgi:hypothetical protein
MVITGQLDVLGAGHALCDVTAMFDADHSVTTTMNDERWDPDRLEDMAGVDLPIHSLQRFHRARAGALALELCDTCYERRIRR